MRRTSGGGEKMTMALLTVLKWCVTEGIVIDDIQCDGQPVCVYSDLMTPIHCAVVIQ